MSGNTVSQGRNTTGLSGLQQSGKNRWSTSCAAIGAIALMVFIRSSDVQAADRKADALRRDLGAASEPASSLIQRPAIKRTTGHKTTTEGERDTIPIVVVRGTPYEMGIQLGKLTGQQMRLFVPRAVSAILRELELTEEAIGEVWSRTAAFSDDRLEQELAGLADGSGVPLHLLQAMHTIPLLMPYFCSSIAAWGEATEDGGLHQTRNLDWDLEVGAHKFPVIVVYIPATGLAFTSRFIIALE